MTSYVFYNSNTGEILHIHQEVAVIGEGLSTPKEELLSGPLMQLIQDQSQLEDVDVIEASGNEPLFQSSGSMDDMTEFYVDVQQQALSEREKGQR
jgi:hypothetical protein